MNIYLVRHGQSEGNISGNVYGATDYPLTALGREQAAMIQAHFKDIPLTAVYSSPLQRAYVIGEMIAKTHDLHVIKDNRLKELDFGIYDDMPLEDVKAKIGQDGYLDIINPFVDVHPKGGIDHQVFRKQLHDFLDELVQGKEDSDEAVAITCHLGIIRVLLQKAIHYDPAYVRLYKTSPGCILRLQYKSGMFKLVELIQTMED